MPPPKANPKLRVRTSAERVFLLSAASLSPIGSYAQLVVCGKESLSPGVTIMLSQHEVDMIDKLKSISLRYGVVIN